jgi:hypothetical protein
VSIAAIHTSVSPRTASTWGDRYRLRSAAPFETLTPSGLRVQEPLARIEAVPGVCSCATAVIDTQISRARPVWVLFAVQSLRTSPAQRHRANASEWTGTSFAASTGRSHSRTPGG